LRCFILLLAGTGAVRATFLRKTNPSSATTLRSEVDDQEQRFSLAFQILDNGIAERAFPAASAAITHLGKLVALKALGRFTYDSDSPAVETDTIFDLASVSKVVATTTMAMILCDRGLLDLEAPLSGTIPEFAGEDKRRRDVTLRMLLAHSSGLPAYEKLYLRAATRDALLQGAFSVALKYNPGTHAEYSDIGFILLGVALERIAKQSLDRFCQIEIFGPLGMAHTTFNPAMSWTSKIAPTADDRAFRKRIIQGEVQDENTSVMDGVAGHAGLFSTARDIAAFAHVMLAGGAPIVRPETVTFFTRREAQHGGTSRALGWDTPSSPSQSGKSFSSSAFGHLGYTGTSLWIDPDRKLSVTLLTNRTWPDCSSEAIKEARPRFHDAVIEALECSS
jgi:CubicO group peptidase (beta-lactamase class C family)